MYMDIPVYSTKSDKINVVSTFLMDGPECGWLFLVGPGGDGKSMATNEAIKLWRRSLGENPEEPRTKIIELPCFRDGIAYKMVLMKKNSTIVKTIVHVNDWTPAWEFMATEWNATVAKFVRGNEV
jgi:hypothetical protein